MSLSEEVSWAGDYPPLPIVRSGQPFRGFERAPWCPGKETMVFQQRDQGVLRQRDRCVFFKCFFLRKACRMPNGTYGGVRGRKTKAGGKRNCFSPAAHLLFGLNSIAKASAFKPKTLSIFGQSPPGQTFPTDKPRRSLCLPCRL